MEYTAAEPCMEISVAVAKALLAVEGYDGDRDRKGLLILWRGARSSRLARKATRQSIPTIATNRTKALSSTSLASASNSARSPRTKTRLSFPSRVSPASPPCAYGLSVLSRCARDDGSTWPILEHGSSNQPKPRSSSTIHGVSLFEVS